LDGVVNVSQPVGRGRPSDDVCCVVRQVHRTATIQRHIVNIQARPGRAPVDAARALLSSPAMKPDSVIAAMRMANTHLITLLFNCFILNF